MAIKPYIVQRRMMELGRVRLGEKAANGAPKKLTTFRFTSASKLLLDAIAEKHGGSVQPWANAPDEGYFEVTSNASEIDIILPPVYSNVDGTPTAPYSQFFEMWSGGGCQRRCDGETEAISGKQCICNPEARDCKLTTRVSFMIPDVPGLGVWRLETHGYNAGVELPGTLEVLILAASEQKFIPAVLRAEQRTKRVPGEPTKKFVVPVIELPHITVKQLASGDVPLTINAPKAASRERPALPAAPEPAPAAFSNGERPAFGAPPELPGADGVPFGDPVQESASVNSGAEADDTQESTGGDPLTAKPKATVDQEPGEAIGGDSPAPPISPAQKKKLNVLVGTLRDGGHITTEHLWRACGHVPELSGDENGELHWAPLRDQLSKAQASELIERLTRLETNVSEGATAA